MKTMNVKELHSAFAYLIEKGYSDLMVFGRAISEDVPIRRVVPHLDTPSGYVTLEEGGDEKRSVPTWDVPDRQAAEVMQNHRLVPDEMACCTAGHDFMHVGTPEKQVYTLICRRCSLLREVSS
jgi:hypothetical protein